MANETTIIRKYKDYKELFFYQKTDTIYQLTYIFCTRFLPKYGDRTVDQMVQAARSGKQNIVEANRRREHILRDGAKTAERGSCIIARAARRLR